MRTHRVYIRNLTSGEVVLHGPEAHHLQQVLRVKSGTAIKAFDGNGLEASGQVTGVEEAQVTLRLEPPVRSEVESPYHLTLAVALLKGDKMSDIVRQATELGASRFVPFKSARADVKILSANKLERWRRVAREAAKQSGRSIVPEITDLVDVTALEARTLGVVAHPYTPASLVDILQETPLEDGSSVTVVTGPEGGLTEGEVEGLTRKRFKPVRLGARILRAETAPVALAAALFLPEAL
jgi:16S rRNA (uracil1498-N3)-methyltransferase